MIQNFVELGVNQDVKEKLEINQNLWGETNRWKEKNVRHNLLISGIPEGGGFVAGKERLDECLNQKDGVFLQLCSGTMFLNLEEQSDRLAEVLRLSGEKVNIVIYSAGTFVLAKALEKYNDLPDKIENVIAINPSIGGKSIRSPLMEMFYPKTKEVIKGLKKVWDKIGCVIISDGDELVNSNYVENTFLEENYISIIKRPGGHTITGKEVNNLFG